MNSKIIKNAIKELMRQNSFCRFVFSPLAHFQRRKFQNQNADWLERNKSFQLNAGKLLSCFKQCLDDAGLIFWLNNGTLLGAYREHRLLGHDIDLDVAMYAKDKDLVHEFLEKKGFKLIHRYGVVNEGVKQHSYDYNGDKIDIFFAEEEDDKFIFHIFFKDTPSECYDDWRVIKMFLPKCELKKYEFLGAEYNIPAKTEEYLAANYGKNFMKPDKYWNYTSDIPCAIYYKLHEKRGYID